MAPGVGVFGTGPLTLSLVPFLRQQGFRVIALWAQTTEAAQKVAGELGIEFHTSRVDDVLLHRDVDLVLVLAAPSLQSQIAVKALGIGKHVVCDRPAGLDQAELLKMVLAAQYYPSLVAAVGYGLRHVAAVQRMRAALLDGYVGDVTLLEARVTCGPLLGRGEPYGWLCELGMGGGALAVIGCHLIDLVCHVSGQRARRALGTLRTLAPQPPKHLPHIRRLAGDDVCLAQLELAGGAFATISVNTRLPPPAAGDSVRLELLVCGSWGHMQLAEGRLSGWRAGGWEQLDGEQDEVEAADSPLQPRLCLQGFRKLLASVARSFSGDDEPSCPAETASFLDAQHVLSVVEAVRESDQRRAWSKVTVRQDMPP